MSKRARQYAGLLCAVISYYLIHEGAHMIYALITNSFRSLNLVGVLGVQIDIYPEKLTDLQMGIFCIVGSVATAAAAYILVALSDRIGKVASPVFKACMYYTTLALLLLDPIYLGILFRFFGGGDMNGIRLLIPEVAAQCIYLGLLLINGFIFWKIVLPKYKTFFA